MLFFFSGLHGDYHKPSDTADKIDAPDAATLLDYVGDVMEHLEDDARTRPQFVRVAEPSEPSAGGGRVGLWAEFRQHAGLQRAA